MQDFLTQDVYKPGFRSRNRHLTMRAGGLGGTRRARTAVSAKAFSRFVGWFPHQAANASRWAVCSYLYSEA